MPFSVSPSQTPSARCVTQFLQATEPPDLEALRTLRDALGAVVRAQVRHPSLRPAARPATPAEATPHPAARRASRAGAGRHDAHHLGALYHPAPAADH